MVPGTQGPRDQVQVTAAATAAAATAAAATATAAAVERAGSSGRFLQLEKCQKCVTVVKNRAGRFFGQVFAIRKVPKVCNCRQKSSGHVFRAGFQARFFENCSHFGWVRRFSLLLTLCARRHEKRTHQA